MAKPLNWLRGVLGEWLGLNYLDQRQQEAYEQQVEEISSLTERVTDLERHFVTGKNKQGFVTETLADIPLEERKARRQLRGATPFQRKAILEARESLPKTTSGAS